MSGQSVPKRHGEKFKCFSGEATCTLVKYTDSVGGGASNCTQELFDAFKKARRVADPRNQGDWQKARRILEEAGWEVFIA